MANDLAEAYGVTQDGFERPGIDEIREFWIEEAQRRLGRTLTGPASAEMQYVELLALAADDAWQQAEANYYAGKYPYARGVNLDASLSIASVDRIPLVPATGEVTFTASQSGGNADDVTISRGTTVSTESGETTPAVPFVTTEPATLPAGQETVSNVPVRGIEPVDAGDNVPDEALGNGSNVPAKTITRLVDAVDGVAGVNNPLPTGGSGTRSDGSVYQFRTGRDREEDWEYRNRYESSLALGGKSTVDAVKSAIENAGNGSIVRNVRVLENVKETDERPSGGPPPNSLRPIVELTADTQGNRKTICQVIQDTRAGGIECYGDVNIQVELNDGTTYPPDEEFQTTDSYGNYRAGNGFDPAQSVAVYIESDVVLLDYAPADVEEQIKNKIIEYIGGTTTDGDVYDGTNIGEDVYYRQVSGRIMDDEIEGVREWTSLNIGRSDPPTGTTNLAIDTAEVATTDASFITLNTTTGDLE